MATKKYLVEKRNVLNDMIAKDFTLQEFRLFTIYLGRINARDISTRIVRLPLTWFYKIMDLQPQRAEYLENITNDLLRKIVKVPTPTGGFSKFQLFKKCIIDKDAAGQWFFEINAHDDALPLMFDFKRDYFTYELWNVLNLDSVNQFRMYELLKAYEKRGGERIISLPELKTLIGLDEHEYPRWNNFRQWILDACQKALKEKTDISFTYEPHTRGKAGKILSIHFTITKNTDYTSQLNLDELIGVEAVEEITREGTEREEVPLDISALDFIQEPITDKDKLTVLEDAKGDVEVVKKAYDMPRPKGGVESLTAWLRYLVRGIVSGEINHPVKANAQNRFVNFPQRKIDFAELERLELEQLKEYMRTETLQEESGPDLDSLDQTSL